MRKVTSGAKTAASTLQNTYVQSGSCSPWKLRLGPPHRPPLPTLPFMAQVQEIATRDDVDAMLDASREHTVALLKHSVACPISARGQEQFVGLEGDDDPPMYAVVVQYARDASTYIAETLGVKHETPQALLIRHGKAEVVMNHHRIKTADLREAARDLAA